MGGNTRARSRRGGGRRHGVVDNRDERRSNEFVPFHEPANEWIHDGHDWMYVIDYTDSGAPIGAYVDDFYHDFAEPALDENDFASAEAYGRYRSELAMLQKRLHEARLLAARVELAHTCDDLDHHPDFADISDDDADEESGRADAEPCNIDLTTRAAVIAGHAPSRG